MNFNSSQLYFVYVIECLVLNHYYVGRTTNIRKRIREHRSKKGAQFTAEYGVRDYWVAHSTFSAREACRLEASTYQHLKALKHIVGGFNDVNKTVVPGGIKLPCGCVNCPEHQPMEASTLFSRMKAKKLLRKQQTS